MSLRRNVANQPYNQQQIIATYKRLICEMPPSNQYLLLYLLDLLSVFARKSDKNLMNATSFVIQARPSSMLLTFYLDLAVIFRPGLISHPNHEMLPGEHALSQQVLEFMIAHQDSFVLDIPPVPAEHPKSARDSATDIDDVETVPTDEERSQLSAGRKFVAKDRPKLPRRRTTAESSGGMSRLPSLHTLAQLEFASDNKVGMMEMSPIPETPTTNKVAFGVARSRTLPSSHKKGVAPDERARVLKKHKRASSSQPSRREAPTKI